MIAFHRLGQVSYLPNEGSPISHKISYIYSSLGDGNSHHLPIALPLLLTGAPFSPPPISLISSPPQEAKMSSLVMDEALKAKAEIYHGDELCRQKTLELLKELELPNGLLPLEDIIEVGIIRENGYVWLKQKKKMEHLFKKIGKLVSYNTEVTAYAEKGKFKKMTGVKSKELLIWVTLTDMYVDDTNTKITFIGPAGLGRTFPISAFQNEEK